MLVTCLIVSSCTAHALIYLDHLIKAFVLPSRDDVTAIETSEYFSSPQSGTLPSFFLTIFNVGAMSQPHVLAK